MFPVASIFFFRAKLDAELLARSLERALADVPVFAARMEIVRGARYIRCEGQGAQFAVASSEHDLAAAIRMAREVSGRWLVDAIDPRTARVGRSPLFNVRVTYLADGSTAIGCCWHHPIGDMHSFMLLMNAWVAAVRGDALPEPLLVEDRIAYLDEHLPPDGSDVSAGRVLGIGELFRYAFYFAGDARRRRMVSLSFDDEEIERMRTAYGRRGARVSDNDVICAHVCEAIAAGDPVVQRRAFTMSVNIRKRCGLDASLIGNLLDGITVDVAKTDDAATIAANIRRELDGFAERHLKVRAIQRCANQLSAFDRRRWVPAHFDPFGRNLLLTSWSRFGVYDVSFGDARPYFFMPLPEFPVPWIAIVVEGLEGRGRLFVVSLPTEVADALTTSEMLARIHRFRGRP